MAPREPVARIPDRHDGNRRQGDEPFHPHVAAGAKKQAEANNDGIGEQVPLPVAIFAPSIVSRPVRSISVLCPET